MRTTLDQIKESVEWTIYNMMREIEATLRVLKSNLYLHPLFHKTNDALMAHLI